MHLDNKVIIYIRAITPQEKNNCKFRTSVFLPFLVDESNPATTQVCCSSDHGAVANVSSGLPFNPLIAKLFYSKHSGTVLA